MSDWGINILIVAMLSLPAMGVLYMVFDIYRTHKKLHPRWRCRRCGQEVDMKAFRCGCSISPSPWEPL